MLALLLAAAGCVHGPAAQPVQFEPQWLVPPNVLQRWHEDMARAGAIGTGSPAWQRDMDFIERELRERGVVDLARRPVAAGTGQAGSAYRLAGVLPGRDYEAGDDDLVLLASVADGDGLATGTGPLAVIAVVDYFAKLTQLERGRSLLVVLDPEPADPARRQPGSDEGAPRVVARFEAASPPRGAVFDSEACYREAESLARAIASLMGGGGAGSALSGTPRDP